MYLHFPVHRISRSEAAGRMGTTSRHKIIVHFKTPIEEEHKGNENDYFSRRAGPHFGRIILFKSFPPFLIKRT